MREIKINEDTCISIGEGIKATVTDNSVVFEKKKEFQNGDIITDGQYIMLCKSFDNNGIVNHCMYITHPKGVSNIDINIDKLRYATEFEKNELLHEMTSHSLMWDEQQKKVVRWRAKKGEMYCYIDSYAAILECREDYWDDIHSLRYDVGNYFHYEDEERQKSAVIAVKNALDSVWEGLPKLVNE